MLLPSPVLYTWYLAWVLPLAWILPRVPRRALIVLSAALLASQLVTESAQIPAHLQHVNLAYGHPVTILVALWVGRDFIRRMRRGTPLAAETTEPVFMDRYESEIPASAADVILEPSAAPSTCRPAMASFTLRRISSTTAGGCLPAATSCMRRCGRSGCSSKCSK